LTMCAGISKRIWLVSSVMPQRMPWGRRHGVWPRQCVSSWPAQAGQGGQH